eukprot:TRINITY_DN806_c0_g1_i2.p1 TRINITY_DN806_c0_g1~~TRINITY_DN806_c0_g1_i2.p1  ORF type:complete len:994 (-),score=262.48 TRINITY_DN806_c0_g1_i2:857-3838(-)
MFWRVAGLATTSPVDTLLDRESFTLEELLDEDDLIQECKSLNGRLVTYLQDKTRVEALVRYIVEDPPEGSDDKRYFKYPFVSCEVFTCEIDMVFNTLLENTELMDLLFSFIELEKSHSALLAGYFSKVVVRLLVRRTHDVMRYLQAHKEILKKLVDLIGITSIMEVIMALMGAEEQILMFHVDSIQWLSETDLLEMLVDKLGAGNSPDVHANAAEALTAVARTMPSALASQLASPKFVSKLFSHVLENPQQKSGLIHALSVCITLLDPRRTASAAASRVARGLSVTSETIHSCSPDTVDGMLQRLGDLVALLDLSGDTLVLPTPYGQLKPPLGIHRLKIVEFIAVLFRTNSAVARRELLSLDVIQTALKLFFDFPFNNLLHHQVESIITSCLESGDDAAIDCLFKDCDLVGKILAADADPYASDSRPEPRAMSNRAAARSGNMGHVIRIANRLVQMASSSSQIDAYLKGNEEWSTWQTDVLQKRNTVENVHQWACGRPSAMEERTGDSDDDEFRERDLDIPSMPHSMTRDFSRYAMFDNEDLDEGHNERDDEDVFFDDEVAELTISSLRMEDHDGDDIGSELLRRAFANPGRDQPSTLHKFEDFDSDEEDTDTSPMQDLVSTAAAGIAAVGRHEAWSTSSPNGPHVESMESYNSDDEVIVGEDEDDDDDFSPRDALPGRPSSTLLAFSGSSLPLPPQRSFAASIVAASPERMSLFSTQAFNQAPPELGVDLFANAPSPFAATPGVGSGLAISEPPVDLFAAANTSSVDVPVVDLFANAPPDFVAGTVAVAAAVPMAVTPVAAIEEREEPDTAANGTTTEEATAADSQEAVTTDVEARANATDDEATPSGPIGSEPSPDSPKKEDTADGEEAVPESVAETERAVDIMETGSVQSAATVESAGDDGGGMEEDATGEEEEGLSVETGHVRLQNGTSDHLQGGGQKDVILAGVGAGKLSAGEQFPASPKSPHLHPDFNDKNFWKSTYDMSLVEGEDL